MRSFHGSYGWRILRAVSCGAFLLAIHPNVTAATTVVLYETHFEASEGYDSNLDLDVQQGWLGTATNTMGDNGLLSGFFPDSGQQAYIGFAPIESGDDISFLWHPATLDPIPPETPIVRFSVQMAIYQSGDPALADYFWWSIHNAQGDRLFSVEFDTYTTNINFILENAVEPSYSGYQFEFASLYDFDLVMDFPSNTWSVMINGTAVVTNQPITENPSTPRNFGDADAVWLYGDIMPGDNFMVFDDYRITSEPRATVQRPILEGLGLSGNGFLLRLNGEPGLRYAIEAADDFTGWTAIRTNVATDGFFEYLDPAAAGLPHRFYRGRLVQ